MGSTQQRRIMWGKLGGTRKSVQKTRKYYVNSIKLI